MSSNVQLPKLGNLRPRLTVIGVGGAGCNGINNMIATGLSGVEFVAANTDAQALVHSSAEHRIQLGVNLTEGLGAGSRPEIGEAAAEEAIEDIRARVKGSHMVFIAAGMGGGTGTGAAAVIARVARELGILTVAVVTKPFQFEGSRRMRVAEAGIAELKKRVDTLIVIPNQNLFRIATQKTTFAEAFVLADQVLYSGVACIVDLIMKDGLINLDFADVRTVMSDMGTAMMGTGEGSGDRRAIMAAEEAIANPLLDDVSLKGAKGLLLSITGGRDLTLYEVDEAASRVRQEVDPEANIIVGATFDESLVDRVRVSIVASGMARSAPAQRAPGTAAEPGWAQSRAPGTGAPEPLRARGQDGAHEADLQRRLSQAMTPGEPQPAPSARETPGRAPRPIWHAPGDVLIEERGPAGGAAEAARGPFAPAPPSEIARASRRMPEIDDFPTVGQREYHAKSGHPGHYGRDPGAGRRAAPEAPRRLGFLQRLTGRGARAGDSSEVDSSDPGRPHASQPGGPPPSRPAAHQPDASQASPQGWTGQAQASDLPSFFGKGRK
jgi:cell division protein FtsZ